MLFLLFRCYNAVRRIAFWGDINCLAYVLNIIVNDILNALIKKTKANIDINNIKNIRNERGGGARVVIESPSKLYCYEHERDQGTLGSVTGCRHSRTPGRTYGFLIGEKEVAWWA
jgi:hypothetical protein